MNPSPELSAKCKVFFTVNGEAVKVLTYPMDAAGVPRMRWRAVRHLHAWNDPGSRALAREKA